MRTSPTLALAVALALSPAASAQLFQPSQTFQSLTPSAFEQFGESVAVDGNFAIVGHPRVQSAPPVTYGAVTILQREDGSWLATGELQAMTDAKGDIHDFGDAVAIHGNRFVAGAPLTDMNTLNEAGAVVIGTINANGLVNQTLVRRASIPQAHARFGSAVAIHGDTVAVGAPLHDSMGVAYSGAVFVFEGPQMQEVTRLASPDGTTLFGSDIAIEGDRMVIAAPASEAAGSTLMPGTAFVYERIDGTWTFTEELDPTPGVFTQDGGMAVAIDGDRILVSDIAADVPNVFGQETIIKHKNHGTVYEFALVDGTWTAVSTLPAWTDITFSDVQRFGTALELDGDTALVQAVIDVYGMGPLSTKREALVYKRLVDGSWLPQGRVDIPEFGAFAEATSFALDGNEALIGVSFPNGGYALNVPFPDDSGSWVPVLGGIEGVLGVPALTGFGTASVGESIALRVIGGAPSSNATLVVGLSGLIAPFKSGALVPSPDILLGGLPLDVDGNLLIPSTWPSGIPADTQIFFQAWIVDGLPKEGLSSTPGLIVTAS